jgi:hypothetical protein
LFAASLSADHGSYRPIGHRDIALTRRATELTADYVDGSYELRELSAGHWLPEAHPSETAGAILDRVKATLP